MDFCPFRRRFGCASAMMPDWLSNWNAEGGVNFFNTGPDGRPSSCGLARTGSVLRRGFNPFAVRLPFIRCLGRCGIEISLGLCHGMAVGGFGGVFFFRSGGGGGPAGVFGGVARRARGPWRDHDTLQLAFFVGGEESLSL